MTRSITDHDVLTFDCYGTLIDWETGIWDALQPLLTANGPASPERDEALRRYARAEAAAQAGAPDALYPTILATVHRALAVDLGLETTPALDTAFAASVPHWPAFPDTATALRSLKKHYRLVILSNVHDAGIAASIEKLGVEFDAVFTAEAIGSYKPDRRNFEYLLANVGATPSRILHTAQSLFHDHVPARELGLATAWIDRQRVSEGGSPGATAPVEDAPETDFVFFTLGEMAEAVRRGSIDR